MAEDYGSMSLMLKALGDENRLMIVDMLSDGELCACKILEKFKLSQPTLSHHMKILCSSGLVSSRKEGKWMHYSLVPSRFAQLSDMLALLSVSKTDGVSLSDSCSCQSR